MTLNHLPIKTQLDNGEPFETSLSYQLFGCELGSAPIVLVNHALTGNSNVAGPEGWWGKLIGKNQTVDTNRFTIVAFNIPGNGFDGVLINDYKKLSVQVIANLFLEGLNQLGITKAHTLIGGSLGGSIAWQMVYDNPDLFENFVPIATDFYTTEWLKAQSYLQDLLLNNVENPLHNARKQAMLWYRTPQSINSKFKDSELRNNVKSWLDYHGEALNKRFQLKAYRLMNHLLSTISVAKDEKKLTKIKSNIYLISVDTDLLFIPDRARMLYNSIKDEKENIYYNEIKSIHGHDAFLIEYDQLNQILKPLFEI